jgi:hypothetical protein
MPRPDPSWRGGSLRQQGITSAWSVGRGAAPRIIRSTPLLCYVGLGEEIEAPAHTKFLVVAPSTRSSLRDKGAGAGAGVQQTTDLLINAPHIKCWSSCPVTSGPRSRSIHARSRAATSRTRWTRRRSRRRVRASRRPAGERFGSVGRRGSEDRPGFRYVLIEHSSAAFRASRTSFFLIAAISLRILCNSLWDCLLSKYSEPSCATMYRSNWLLRTVR